MSFVPVVLPDILAAEYRGAAGQNGSGRVGGHTAPGGVGVIVTFGKLKFGRITDEPAHGTKKGQARFFLRKN